MAKSPDVATQGKLGRRAGVSQSTVGRIMRAEVAAEIDTLDAIAAVFGLSAWQLLHPLPHVQPTEAAFYARLRTLLDQQSK